MYGRRFARPVKILVKIVASGAWASFWPEHKTLAGVEVPGLATKIEPTGGRMDARRSHRRLLV